MFTTRSAGMRGRYLGLISICIGAGMIVACLTVTGLVISLGTIITSAAGGNW